MGSSHNLLMVSAASAALHGHSSVFAAGLFLDLKLHHLPCVEGVIRVVCVVCMRVTAC